MKCPKCGYNSFEHHDVCKKCSNELSGYKATFGLKALVFPQEVRSSMAAAFMAEAAVGNHVPEEIAEPSTDMFSFDLPDDDTSEQAANSGKNPFDFGDEPATSDTHGFGEFSFDDKQKSAQAKAEEEAFADLLESTSQEDDAAVAPAAASKPGEFDLDNFSWDDTATAPAAAETKPEDDFNSLFGDMDEPAKK